MDLYISYVDININSRALGLNPINQCNHISLSPLLLNQQIPKSTISIVFFPLFHRV